MTIRPELADLAQPIDSVTTHPRNVRQGDVGAIAESLKAHGQYRPIVVHRATGHIIAGNHTYLAAKSLGWSSIAVTYYDGDDDGALRVLLADNKANDLAIYDDRALANLLTDLAHTERSLAGSMFTGDDLDDLLFRLEGTVGNALNDLSLDEIKAGGGTSTRSIVLPLSADEYVTVTKQLHELREAAGDDNNSATFIRIVGAAYANLAR